MRRFLRPSLDWLLVFVPVALALESLAPQYHIAVFFCAAAGIIPLAGWLGRATEHLAERAGAGVGALLNATFGNAAELIIGLVALKKGLRGVVKASLTGSILGNVLLVLGAAALAGGLRFHHQRFNRAGARSQSTMLILAAIALTMPAAYHHVAGLRGRPLEGSLSLAISIVLLAVYACSLVFSLRTHKQLFDGGSAPAEEEGEKPAHEAAAASSWSLGRSLGVLAGSTALVAWMSEVLVGAVGETASELGMTELFIGVFVVAIVGNAAEHSTAVMAARANKMELALGIAVGSSVQIALLVAPVLVIASHFIGPAPMDLVFSPSEVISVGFSVLLASQIAGDGESNWLEGVQLLAVYAILAIVFYFIPA
ncbi:MAG TPA: calcium/proton exchanger [Thermoanaerobaculia bacterium]|nr:calcium/proton exchanger [Thermoanaerobaculia bacterium]